MNQHHLKSRRSGEKAEHHEGPIAKAIEHETAKLPSDAFLWAAFGSMGASLLFQLFGKKETSHFIGQWAPTLLIFGVYNKLVKIAGSDRQEGQLSEVDFTKEHD